MTAKAKLVLKVTDTIESSAYYERQLGWSPIQEDSTSRHVFMEIVPGYYVVLSVDPISMPELWLNEIVHRPEPGSLFYVNASSVEEKRRQLVSREVRGYHIEETGTIRKLLVPTLDNYTAVYWEELRLSADDVIALYANGPQELRKALSGLDEDTLDFTLKPGKWSIRQHVLHLIDLEMVAIHKLKFALAETGKEFRGTPFSQNSWNDGLLYAWRPIDLEVDMFELLRGHVLRMCEALPDALHRFVRNAGKEESVERLLKMMVSHANHHIHVIIQIKKVHQL
jgi:hypothetical protein